MTDTPLDLYCPACGYNLRGLPGDPIRCPECGGTTPRNALELTEADVTARAARCGAGH